MQPPSATMDPLTLGLGTALALLAIVGIADAAYFIGVSYRWLAPDAPWIPRVCRMDEGTCARIVDTSYGRALGLPNAVYGAVWYLLVLGLAGAFLATGRVYACLAFQLAAAGTVLFSVYLLWALRKRLEVHCPLCYLGHAINTAILVVLLVIC